MFEAKFENELGSLQLSGGKGAMFRTLKAEGLGLPEREFNVMGYGGQPGQVLISEKELARVITLSGDVVVRDDLRHRLSSLLKILYRPGILTIYTGGGRRKIPCRCTTVSDPERHGPKMAMLVLQFTCDQPYFKEEEPRNVSLFRRSDLIAQNFCLPCVFTERVHRLTIVNRGDVEAEPVVTVCCDAESGESQADSIESGLCVMNHTTGASLVLDREFAAGEQVTIDIANRKILSNLAGDITGSVSQSSFLSEFVLAVGPNDIEVVNRYIGQKIGVCIEFYNQFIEAVI